MANQKPVTIGEAEERALRGDISFEEAEKQIKEERAQAADRRDEENEEQVRQAPGQVETPPRTALPEIPPPTSARATAPVPETAAPAPKDPGIVVKATRFVTPWDEEKETFLEYMQGYPGRVKETFEEIKEARTMDVRSDEVQAKLKAKHDSYEQSPLWAKALFRPEVIFDKKNNLYIPLLTGEAPAVGGKPSLKAPAKLPAKVVKKAAKVAVKEKIDWSKITKAVAAGKVKSAEDAAKQAAKGKYRLADWKVKPPPKPAAPPKPFRGRFQSKRTITQQKAKATRIQAQKAQKAARNKEQWDDYAKDFAARQKATKQDIRVFPIVKPVQRSAAKGQFQPRTDVKTLPDADARVKPVTRIDTETTTETKPATQPTTKPDTKPLTEPKTTPDTAPDTAPDEETTPDPAPDTDTPPKDTPDKPKDTPDKPKDTPDKPKDTPDKPKDTPGDPKDPRKPGDPTTGDPGEPPPPPPPPPGKGLRLKIPPGGKSDAETRQEIMDAPSAIAWRQGSLKGRSVYHVLKEPYQSNDDVLTVIGAAPKGARIVKGPGSAKKSVQLIRGPKLKRAVSVDAGIVDANLSPSGSKAINLRFTPDPKGLTTSDLTISKGRPSISGRGRMRITPKRPRIS